MTWQDPRFEKFYRRLLSESDALSWRTAAGSLQEYRGDVARQGMESGVGAARFLAGFGGCAIARPAESTLEAFEKSCNDLGLRPGEADYAVLMQDVEARTERNLQTAREYIQRELTRSNSVSELIPKLDEMAHEVIGRIRREIARRAASRRSSRVGIFVSHITEDAALAQKLQALLRRGLGEAIPVFVSSDYQSIRSGDDWHDRIVSALRSHAVTISLITPTSGTRPWINYEAGVADGAENLLIPVVARGFKEGDLRPPLMRRHARSLAKREAVSALLNDVAVVLGASLQSDVGALVDDLVGMARRPDLARDLSGQGMELARAMSERCQDALVYERLDAEGIANDFNWPLDEFGVAVAELERLHWVATDEIFGSELGYISIRPTEKFFIETEASFTDIDPRLDALDLARLVIEKEDVLQLATAAQELGWSPRRINVAAYILVSQQAVRSQESDQSAPFAYWFLEKTAHTRRIVKRAEKGA